MKNEHNSSEKDNNKNNTSTSLEHINWMLVVLPRGNLRLNLPLLLGCSKLP